MIKYQFIKNRKGRENTEHNGSTGTKRLSLWIGLYLVIQPLLDILTALGIRAGSSFSAGTWVRAAFLLAAVLWVLFAKPFPEKKMCVAVLILCGVYLLAFLAVMYFAGGIENCLANLHDTGKMLFVPLTAVFLYAAWKQRGVRVPEWGVAGGGSIYAVFLLLAVLTDTSAYSYRTGFGYKGWFYAANEVSCILAIAGPVTVEFCLEQIYHRGNRWWLRGLLIGLVLFSVAFSATYLGTKIVFAVLFVYAVAAFVWTLCASLRSHSRVWKPVMSGVVAAVIAVLFLTSPLSSYLDNVYLARMSVSSEEIAERWNSAPTDAAEGVSVGVNETAAAAAAASEGTWLRTQIAEKPFLQKLDQILSRRLLSASPSVEEFRNGGIGTKLFGIGYANAERYERRVDFLIEIDGLALLVRHGILGFLLYYLPYLAVFVALIIRFFRKPDAYFQSLRRCTYLYSALAAFVISAFAGHVLSAPAVGIYMLAVTVTPDSGGAPEKDPVR